MRSACRPRSRPLLRATWASRCSVSRASPTPPPAWRRGRSITRRSSRRRIRFAGRSIRYWRGSLTSSNGGRLSVTLVEVSRGKEAEFMTLATEFETVLARKNYGRAEIMRDEAHPLHYYAVRRWVDVAAAEACHADAEVQALTAHLYRIARVTHIVN